MPDDQDYGGPWLQAAGFCEKVLLEKDGVASLIRMVDRFTVTAAGAGAPEKMPPTNLNITAFISLKSGFARGSAELKLVGRNPSQQVCSTANLPLFLEGEDRGASAVLEMTLQVSEDGLYWFDVLLGGRLLTRMPLRVIYQRIMPGPGLVQGEH